MECLGLSDPKRTEQRMPPCVEGEGLLSRNQATQEKPCKNNVKQHSLASRPTIILMSFRLSMVFPDPHVATRKKMPPQKVRPLNDLLDPSFAPNRRLPEDKAWTAGVPHEVELWDFMAKSAEKSGHS